MTQLSGSITVESTINKGSTFRVSLPRELIIDYHPLKQTPA
jgi:chemotaxis protein histidine kinase CheA